MYLPWNCFPFISGFDITPSGSKPSSKLLSFPLITTVPFFICPAGQRVTSPAISMYPFVIWIPASISQFPSM